MARARLALDPVADLSRRLARAPKGTNHRRAHHLFMSSGQKMIVPGRITVRNPQPALAARGSSALTPRLTKAAANTAPAAA